MFIWFCRCSWIDLCIKHKSGDVVWCRALLHSVWRYSHQVEHTGQLDVSFPWASFPIPQHPIYCMKKIEYAYTRFKVLAHWISLYADNFMTGYRMVFDRDNLKLGWSLSDCELLSFFPINIKKWSSFLVINCLSAVALISWRFKFMSHDAMLNSCLSKVAVSHWTF